MATRSLTYLDIPVTIRQESASNARTNLQAMLASPVYTEEQREAIQRQIAFLTTWEAGKLEVEGLPVATSVVVPRPGAIKTDFR